MGHIVLVLLPPQLHAPHQEERRSHVPTLHKLCGSVILQPTLFIRIRVWQFTSCFKN